jgi:enamine deaminase RidA (YjgF/YER057c/UK114 family)
MSPESTANQIIDVFAHPTAETIEAYGCSIVLRRVDGPEARELFFHCRPPDEAPDAAGQAEAIYRAILSVLDTEGVRFGSVVSETIFLRDLRDNVQSVREARRRVLTAHDEATDRLATTEIGQPPLNERACLEVSMQAVLPNDSPARLDPIRTRSACDCAECADVHGLRIVVDGEDHLHASGLYGKGDNAYAQTLAMFGLAEDVLRKAGMEFSDVVRTWIYLRDMDRDYQDLNRARRVFFEARGIDPVPASTGIGGGLVPEAHDLCLSIYAVKAERPPPRTVMTSPTLNEAMQYGADFVRGMRIVEANKVALHVSGTASIDEAGRTAHAGDFEAQADRMLVNIAALLEGQGADFRDVLSAITYLKDPEDGERLLVKLRAAGFEGFPHALVAAPICRPDLLCETEVLAVLPQAAPGT